MQIFTRIMRFPTQNSALQNNKLEKKRMKWDENHNRCFIWWSMRFLCSHFQHSIKLHRRAFSLELLKNFIFPGTIQMDRKCITKETCLFPYYFHIPDLPFSEVWCPSHLLKKRVFNAIINCHFSFQWTIYKISYRGRRRHKIFIEHLCFSVSNIERGGGAR